MTSAVLLTGCEKTHSDGADCSFDYAMIGHPESLDPQLANDPCSFSVIGNVYTGLFTMTEDGKLKNGAAEKYSVSDDGLTYNFTIRKNCFWFFDENHNDEVEKKECTNVTAKDFEFAFRRIFDPNTHSPHKEAYSNIKNADAIINGDEDYEAIGVSALSDTELVIELEKPDPEFLNSLAQTPAMPCNEKFFYDTKGRYGLDDKSVMSNGAFFIRQWFYDPYGHDNLIYMQRNLANTDYDKIYPTALNIYMKDSYEDARKSFDDGESDVILSFLCDNKEREEYSVKKFENYTVGIITNPSNPEYGNVNIRKALAYGIDKDSFDGVLSEDLAASYGIVPPGVTFDGKRYRDIVKDKDIYKDENGEAVKYDPELAAEYYHQGMEELELQSLSNIKLLVREDLMDSEYLHLVTQNWQTLFGFYIGIDEVPAEEFSERIKSGDYTLALYPLSGDRNSPLAFEKRFSSKLNDFGYINSDIDDALESMSEDGMNADSLGEVETEILKTFYFIPVFYKSEYEIMSKGNHDIMYDPFTKQLFFRYAKYYEE